MTDLSLKNKIIAIASYLCTAVVLTYQKNYIFSMIYFVCVGLVLFFADKLFDSKKIKEKTLCAFLLTSVAYQTLSQIYFSSHEKNKQLMVAAAVAILVAILFAMTDKSKLSYTIVVAPVLCLLDLRIALCYSCTVIAWAVTNVILGERHDKKVINKKTKKNKVDKKSVDLSSVEQRTLFISTALVSIICFAVCIYFSAKKETAVIEKYDYILQQFKNTIGFVIALIYLLIKALKLNTKPAVRISIVAGILLCIVPVTFFVKVYGWASVSLALICSIAYLGLICFENEQIIQSIKDDYSKSKYLFWVLLLLMLR